MINAIQATALFAPMPAEGRQALARGARLLDLPRGQELDCDPQGLAILLDGAAAMVVHEGGRRAVIAAIAAPTALNLAEVVAGAPCRAQWRTLAPSRLLLVSGADFRSALRGDPGLAAHAAGELASAYRALLDGAAEQRLHSAQQRLASYLASLTQARAGQAVVRLPYEKNVLASLLGMTPENFSRALARLSPFGVVVNGPEIRLSHVEWLRDAASTAKAD